MRILDLLDRNSVKLNGGAKDKTDVLNQMVDLMAAGGKEPRLAAMTVPAGVEYDALDGEPVDLVFLIASPEDAPNVHIDVLSKLSMMLMNKTFTASLKSAKTVDEFLQMIDAAETEKDEADVVKEEAAKATNLAENRAKEERKSVDVYSCVGDRNCCECIDAWSNEKDGTRIIC